MHLFILCTLCVGELVLVVLTIVPLTMQINTETENLICPS